MSRVDVEQELQRVLRTRDTPLPVADPVGAVHRGMRHRRRTQRLQVVSAALGVAVVALAASLFVGNPLRSSSTPAPPASHGPTPAATKAASDLTAVPAGFEVTDLSFVSLDLGWALGTVPCGPASCLIELVTTDGGSSWVRRSAAGLPRTCTDTDCVGRLRFADARVGYAFGPSLYVTSDGGGTWTQLRSGDVAGLEGAGGTAVRVVSTQHQCAPGCSYVLQRSAVGSVNWTTVHVGPQGGHWVAASLTRRGDRLVAALFAHASGGALDARTSLIDSRDAGATWQERADPCGPVPKTGSDEVDTTEVSTGPDGQQVLLCRQRLAGTDGYSLRFSADGGRTFSEGRPLAGAVARVAAVSPERAVASVFADGTVRLMLTDDGGRTWRTVASQPEPQGSADTAYLAFSTAHTGTWVGPDRSVLWRTSDGGSTWTEHPFRDN